MPECEMSISHQTTFSELVFIKVPELSAHKSSLIKVAKYCLFRDLSGGEVFLDLPVRELEVFPIKADKSDLKLASQRRCSRGAARLRHPRYYV